MEGWGQGEWGVVRRGGKPTGRIQGIDIDAQIHGAFCADPLTDLGDDAIDPNLVDLARLHNLEAAVAVIVVVAEPGQGGPDAGVDVAVVGQ